MTEVFVFGSNLAGRHGAGSAKEAMLFYGAIYGNGHGPQGIPPIRSYVIPTKDRELRTLPLRQIKEFVRIFLTYAKASPDLTFRVVPIGCGLAGYKPSQIAPMFAGAPENVRLPKEFWAYLVAQPRSERKPG